MPYNGTGTFVRVHDWTQDRTNGVPIDADRMDAEMDGMATGLSTAITRDGQTTVTADIPLNGHKITGLGAATASGDAVSYDQLFAGVPAVITTNDTLTSDDIGKLNSYDCTAGAVTVTLPSAVTVGNGAELTIVKTDPSGNFITVTSVGGELLGYPSATYNFHGTAGTAVSNVGGFVRVTMSEENRVFVTNDKVRIAGVVGFAALNADHTITRPASSTGVSTTAIDLTVPYAAGYTSGGTVKWIQTSHQIRVCNGTATYVSNGTHWVTKYSTSDVWTGPKDFLFGERNSGYAGPAIPGVHVAGAAGKIEALQNAFGHRPLFESIAMIQSADPVDLVLGMMYREGGIMSEAPATRLPNGQGVAAIYGVGSDQLGNVSTRLAAITFLAGEDITTAGSGGTLRLSTTPVGYAQTLGRVEIRATGKVWLGGQEDRGTICAEPSLLSAGGVLSGAVNAADGDTVTIDAVVYTFETGALDAAYKVKVGATAKESLENLAEAINLTGTVGTHYGSGTLIHPTVHGIGGLGGNNVLNVYAKTQGAAGNAIATTEVSSYTWANATLTGGKDVNTTHLDVDGGVAGDPKVTLLANSTIGGISDVALRLAAKGTAYIHTDDPFIPNMTAALITTAGDVTYTVTQVVRGLLVRDCNGASRADTLPTAADLVAAIPGCAVGDTIRTYIVNGSDAAETITITEGAGGTWPAAQTAASRIIPQNASKTVHMRLNNVTAASEAYIVYA